MKYAALTTDAQTAMLQQRLAQLEADHYGHTLNLAALATLPDTDPSKAELVEAAQAAQVTLDGAHAAATAELGKLAKPPKK